MEPDIKSPKNILDEEAYEQLPSKDKALYLEKVLQDILILNKNTGVTIPTLLEIAPFSRKGISKYLEKLVARRVAYKIQQGNTIMYHINGRLIHHIFEKNITAGNRDYSFKALFDGKQVSIFIQEIKKNELGVIEEGGGIIVPLKSLDEFSTYISKIKNEIPIIKEKLMEMIE